MREIAKRQEDHVWNSKGTAQRRSAVCCAGSREATKPENPKHASHRFLSTIRSSPNLLKEPARRSLPAEFFWKPQLALESTNPPDAEGYAMIKLDSYRIQAPARANARCRYPRSGLDWTHHIPAIAQAVARCATTANSPGRRGWQGCSEDAATNFRDLRASFQQGANNPLTYFCFDLLHIDGRNPRDLGLRQRKTCSPMFVGSGRYGQLQRALEYRRRSDVSAKPAICQSIV